MPGRCVHVSYREKLIPLPYSFRYLPAQCLVYALWAAFQKPSKLPGSPHMLGRGNEVGFRLSDHGLKQRVQVSHQQVTIAWLSSPQASCMPDPGQIPPSPGATHSYMLPDNLWELSVYTHTLVRQFPVSVPGHLKCFLFPAWKYLTS